jgi:hypothetical protein
MLNDIFTPRRIVALLAAATLLMAGLSASAYFGLVPKHSYLGDLVSLLVGALPRAIAFKLFLDIADEHRDVRLVRLAWQALALHAALRFVRGVVGSRSFNVLVQDSFPTPLEGFLKHGLGLSATLFLLLGLLGMLLSYRRAGLEPQRGRCYSAAIVISLALFGYVLLCHKSLEQGQSAWMINRLLQPLDLILGAAASVVSIILYRYVLSLDGGKLAQAVRWLVVYGLLSGGLVLLIQIVAPALRRAWGFDAMLGGLWALLPWVMTLAASVRAQMSVDAMEQIARLRKSAGSERSVLAQSV